MPAASRNETELGILEHLMARGEMLASQMPGASHWSPEKRLAASVFASALVEIRDHAGERKYRYRITEDLQWIHSNERTWPFSFLRLCELFNLSPDWVRSVVTFWVNEPNASSRRTFSTFRQAA